MVCFNDLNLLMSFKKAISFMVDLYFILPINEDIIEGKMALIVLGWFLCDFFFLKPIKQ